MIFLDITTNGQAINDDFAAQIKLYGGKISKILTKSTTHVIWQKGSITTLKKLGKYEGIEVVSPLWICECIQEKKLVDCDLYRPYGLDEILKGVKKDQVASIKGSIFKNLDQNRLTDPKYFKSTTDQEGSSHAGVRKYSITEINEKIKKINEDRFFDKEFAKDIQKLQKLEQNHPQFSTQQKGA